MSSNLRILVYRIGQLGDTIVAIPSIRALSQHFPEARLTLLCDRHSGSQKVLASDVLKGSGLVDTFETYAVADSIKGRLLKFPRKLILWSKLRRLRFDIFVYLAPSIRSSRQVQRDKVFFGSLGIPKLMGFKNFPHLLGREAGLPLHSTPFEADLLLARLAADGITIPQPGTGSMDIGLGDHDHAEMEAWLLGLVPAASKTWVAIGPGSKMPAKRWSLENFALVGSELIHRFNIWPVIFGGPEDQANGNQLLHKWGRGYNAAGALGIRGAAAALKRCLLYVGNDTGTMHLAAAAGTRCVALFSAREWPGMWHPYGKSHRVLRKGIDCEGCGLSNCTHRKSECLTRIAPIEVVQACCEVLSEVARTETT